jgi:hypothetical protein
MASTKHISVRCQHCKEWFPSPIFFGDSENFDTSDLYVNTAQCSHCGKMTDCNKENVRVRYVGGGFVGEETT